MAEPAASAEVELDMVRIEGKVRPMNPAEVSGFFIVIEKAYVDRALTVVTAIVAVPVRVAVTA